MIFDILAPPQGAGQKKICAVARPIHVSNPHTKFGLILSNGLGGDSVTDGQTEAIAISPTVFKKIVGIMNSHWHFKPFYTLMDFSFWFDTINLGRSIVNIKGSQVVTPK